jgi:hypothetical protein
VWTLVSLLSSGVSAASERRDGEPLSYSVLIEPVLQQCKQ